MASIRNEQKRNDTTKKSPVKRYSLNERKEKIAEMRKQKKVLKRRMLEDDDDET